MTWKDAKTEAETWIKQHSFPEHMQGKEVDLDVLAKDMPYIGQFKEMVLRAVARNLKGRGAKIQK